MLAAKGRALPPSLSGEPFSLAVKTGWMNTSVSAGTLAIKGRLRLISLKVSVCWASLSCQTMRPPSRRMLLIENSGAGLPSSGLLSHSSSKSDTSSRPLATRVRVSSGAIRRTAEITGKRRVKVWTETSTYSDLIRSTSPTLTSLTVASNV